MGLNTPAIYLVRHAEPDWSRTDIPYHLPPGPPLTALGLEEARQAGLYLAQAGVGQFFASPLERALHTARIAAGLSGAALQVDERLRERQPGEPLPEQRSRMRSIFEQACLLGVPAALVSHGGPIGALLQELGMPEQELKGWQRFDHNNPVPTAGVWEASRDGGEGSWKLSLVFWPGSHKD